MGINKIDPSIKTNPYANDSIPKLTRATGLVLSKEDQEAMRNWNGLLLDRINTVTKKSDVQNDSVAKSMYENLVEIADRHNYGRVAYTYSDQIADKNGKKHTVSVKFGLHTVSKNPFDASLPPRQGESKEDNAKRNAEANDTEKEVVSVTFQISDPVDGKKQTFGIVAIRSFSLSTSKERYSVEYGDLDKWPQEYSNLLDSSKLDLVLRNFFKNSKEVKKN
jgi:rubrerythrin